MREADSAKNLVAGVLQKSRSSEVQLSASMLAQGSVVAAKRPPSGMHGVSVP